MSQAQQYDVRADNILRYIAAGTASAIGDDFFNELCRHLSAALDVKWSFVTEFGEDRSRVCILAFWNGEEFAKPFEYEIRHTPCESVLLGEVAFYPSEVQKKFPLHHELADLGVESYLAIPITNRAGEVIGHLASMHDRPMAQNDADLNIFKIFGARAGAELERKHAEEYVHRSEERLSSILRTAMDAIVTVDENRRITLFNQAAEEMIRCTADWAMGQPIDRFIGKRHRKTFDAFLENLEPAGSAARQIWIPEGLTGLRANGDEFPVEGTLSPLHLGEHRYFTFILRDINDRAKAESAIKELQEANQSLQEEIRRQQEMTGLIGDSSEMQALLGNISKVASTDSTVLLTGETGTGKELIARAVHGSSARRERTLVIVNCAALPSELIESELFGHERGAFTGATNQRKGRFELADGGTIFLDEVGELSAQAQAKLLRVLQEQTFERVGGGCSIRVDVRVVAATNRNLADMVAAGTFRADLYYRLNVFPLQVPPLRERNGDVALLAEFFVEKYSRKLGKTFEGISPASLQRLKRYEWPGNVRELQNVIERVAILANGPMLEVPEGMLTPSSSGKDSQLYGTLDQVAQKHILRVLENCDGIIEGENGAAALLGLKPSTLRFRMKQLGIVKPSRRAL